MSNNEMKEIYEQMEIIREGIEDYDIPISFTHYFNRRKYTISSVKDIKNMKIKALSQKNNIVVLNISGYDLDNISSMIKKAFKSKKYKKLIQSKKNSQRKKIKNIDKLLKEKDELLDFIKKIK